MGIRLSFVVLAFRFWVPLLLVVAYAWRRGGAPERIVAAMLLTAAVATVVVRSDFATRFSWVHPQIVVVDVILFCGLLAVALRADRIWPMPLTALQGVTLMGHVGKILNPDLWSLGYAVMIALPVLPGITILAIGTWRHQRRVRRTGNDRSWND